MEKNNVALCKTKAGNGFKVVVAGEWYYTSNREMSKLLAGDSRACQFRSREEIEARQAEQEPAPVIKQEEEMEVM